jgi:tetratricopeptide (TPR) repeat protein
MHCTTTQQQVIAELNVLAVLRYAMGRLDAAEPLLRRVLTLREATLGSSHHDVAESLINLAVLLNVKGQYEEALGLLERALEVTRLARGAQHAETAECLAWIAETNQKLQRFEIAESIYR